MKPASAKFENVTHLMKELQKELKSFPAYERELSDSFHMKNKEITDMMHIIENVELTPYEAIKVVEKLREARIERRLIKEMQTVIAPLQEGLTKLMPMLNTQINLSKRQADYSQRDTAYTFRSPGGFQLLQEVVQNYDVRSTVPLYSPGTFIPANEPWKNTSPASVPSLEPELPWVDAEPEAVQEVVIPQAEPAIAAPEEAPVSIVELENEAEEPKPAVQAVLEAAEVVETVANEQQAVEPVSEKPNLFETAVHLEAPKSCEIVMKWKDWFLYVNGKSITRTTELSYLMDKVFEREWDVITTNEQSRHVLLWTLKQLKRSEPDKSRVAQYESVLRKLDKSKMM